MSNMQAVDKWAIIFLMHVSPLQVFTIICEYIGTILI